MTGIFTDVQAFTSLCEQLNDDMHTCEAIVCKCMELKRRLQIKIASSNSLKNLDKCQFVLLLDLSMRIVNRNTIQSTRIKEYITSSLNMRLVDYQKLVICIINLLDLQALNNSQAMSVSAPKTYI